MKQKRREWRHGADGEVGEMAGDADPGGAGIRVGGPPAAQKLLGVVEAQLEFQQSFPCQDKQKPNPLTSLGLFAMKRNEEAAFDHQELRRR